MSLNEIKQDVASYLNENPNEVAILAEKTSLNVEQLLEKMIDAGKRDNHLVLHLDSTHLNLAAKEVIEKILKSSLAAYLKPDEQQSLALIVNFRKPKRESQNPNDGQASKRQPAPLPRNQKSAFGLQMDKKAIPGVKHIIAVASGKGGVGKSTVSVNLATALVAKGARVGFVDADIYGPSAPEMFGAQGPLGVSANKKLIPVEAHGVQLVSFGFLTDVTQPVIWRGPMVSKALKQLFYDVEWGKLDYLVVDLPPGTGDVQLTMIENLPIKTSVIVTTPQNIALLDAHKAVSMFERLDVPILGVVENMAFYHCPACGHQDDVFGTGGGQLMAEGRAVPLLARIPLNSDIRQAADQGVPAVIHQNAMMEAFSEVASKLMELA